MHNGFELLALVVSVALILAWTRWVESLSTPRVLAALGIIGVSVYLGGRLHFVLLHWSESSSLLRVFKLWSSIHAAGALAGAAVGVWVASRLLALPLGKLADSCVPAAGVGIALARLGCFAHGCCFGAVCSLPWCFAWPSGSPPARYHGAVGLVSGPLAASLPIHPLQLYFAAAGLAIGATACALYRFRRFEGQVALAGLTGLMGSTLLLELTRQRPIGPGPPGAPPLLLAAAMLCSASLAVLVVLSLRRRGSGGLSNASARDAEAPSTPARAAAPRS